MDRSAVPVSHEAPSDLESSLQQLKLGDCAYFLRTGTCAFGSKCRYNHPTAEGLQLSLSRNNVESLPERPGQIECQFFIKTGVCKFGPACRFHHPRPNSGSQGTEQLRFNFLGLPLRPSEKDCAYYLQTGSCTYGSTCKLNHPQPTSAESVQQSLSTSSNLSNGMSMPTPLAYQDQGNTWPGNGTCVIPSTVGMPIPFRTAVVTSSPQYIPGSGLNFHQQSGYDLKVPTADMYPKLCPRGPPYPQSQEHSAAGIALARATATILHGQTIFPERPGQPDCHHYMKTGDCKFGMNCKFHHPKDRAVSLPSGLNPMGLPLRPGKQACPYYVKHGICKFGPVCKFDHPLKILPHSPPYSPSRSSLNEVPVAPFVPGSSSPVTLGSEMSERHQNSVDNDQATFKNPVSEQHT